MDPLTQQIFRMGGQVATGYWITEISGSTGLTPARLSTDSLSNPKCLLNSNLQSHILQFNENGLIASQRRINLSSSGKINTLATNGSGVTYLAGEDFIGSSVGICSIYGPVDSNLTLFDAGYTHYSSFSTVVNNGYSHLVFSYSGYDFSVPGEPVACGYKTSDNYATFNAYVRKIGSWEKSLASNTVFSGGFTTDNFNASIYLAGATGSLLETPLLVRYNSSGTLQWTRTVGSGSGSEQLSGIAGAGIVKSGGSFRYVVGSTKSVRPGFNDPLLFCLNDFGSIIWQKALSATSGSNTGIALSVGAGDEIRIVAQWGNGIMVASYSNSGSLMWQRLLTHSSYTLVPKSVQLVGNAVHVLAGVNGSDIVVLCKFRLDGTGTGTFGNYTYAAGTGLDTTTSLSTSFISVSEVSIPQLGSGSYGLAINASSQTQSQPLIA